MRAWLAEKQEGDKAEGLPWRVHFLLADMAAARKDAKAEQAALLTAMGTFPEKDQSEPMKTSQFQHMANRYAWSLMETKSFRKASSWLAGELAKDRRFRCVYLQAWEDRVDKKQMKQLTDAVAKAYKKRKKRFKDLAVEIDIFSAGLR